MSHCRERGIDGTARLSAALAGSVHPYSPYGLLSEACLGNENGLMGCKALASGSRVSLQDGDVLRV